MPHLVIAVADFAVRIAAAVILSKSRFADRCTVAIRPLPHPLHRQGTSKFPGSKFANRQMTESFTLVRWLSLFYNYTVDLSVIGNNRQETTPRLRSTRPPLKRIQNVFKSIINFINSQVSLRREKLNVMTLRTEALCSYDCSGWVLARSSPSDRFTKNALAKMGDSPVRIVCRKP